MVPSLHCTKSVSVVYVWCLGLAADTVSWDFLLGKWCPCLGNWEGINTSWLPLLHRHSSGVGAWKGFELHLTWSLDSCWRGTVPHEEVPQVASDNHLSQQRVQVRCWMFLRSEHFSSCSQSIWLTMLPLSLVPLPCQLAGDSSINETWKQGFGKIIRC